MSRWTSGFSRHFACLPAKAGTPTALFLAILLLGSTPAPAESPIAVPVKGEPFAARLTGVDAQGQLGFDAGGKSRGLALADLVTWGQLVEPRKGPVVVLADGGLLPAALLSTNKTELALDSALLGSIKLSWDGLAGIVFRPPPFPVQRDALFDRVARPPGQTDRLILDNGDELTGLIDTETLAGDKLRIKGNLGPVEIAVRRVVALIFNPSLRQQAEARPRTAWLGMSDGARLLAAGLQLNGDSLEVTTLSGAKWKAAATDLVFLMPVNGRAVYLSDIRPSEYRFLPYLDLKWPYQNDRNVTGGELRCRGRLYLKGIGVHSAARLTYRLDQPWSRLQADVGIDDSTGGQGSVGFRVFVDGKLKFSSPPIRGGGPPQAVSIDLAGGKRLDLVVDYGEAGDVMDHADWLGARLVK